MKIEKAFENFVIAFEAVKGNKVRSGLTALGIIFGVAAVIIMLAIGKGAQKEILDQIKLVGVNNIIITPILEDPEKQNEAETSKKIAKKYSPGLTMLDVSGIRENIPSVERVSPEINIEIMAINGPVSMIAKLTGIDASYFDIFNLELSQGRFFNALQQQSGASVCVIGSDIRSRLFSKNEPLGSTIKCGNNWLTVIGVLQPRPMSDAAKQNLKISDYNSQVYVPVQTVLSRYRNRGAITEVDINGGKSTGMNDGEEEQSAKPVSQNINQLDKIIVQVRNTEQVSATSEVITAMMHRRHAGVDDVEITVPELLLKQQQRTKDIFNIVLGAIASISLIVGGIGIMNIMLASVLERIKEIGLRLSIGATKKDIVVQFLTESVLISVTGGLIGIIIGISGAYFVSVITGIHTIISGLSIFISFAVSAGVGILFGYMPAKKAAEQDPVTSLRYE